MDPHFLPLPLSAADCHNSSSPGTGSSSGTGTGTSTGSRWYGYGEIKHHSSDTEQEQTRVHIHTTVSSSGSVVGAASSCPIAGPPRVVAEYHKQALQPRITVVRVQSMSGPSSCHEPSHGRFVGSTSPSPPGRSRLQGRSQALPPLPPGPPPPLLSDATAHASISRSDHYTHHSPHDDMTSYYAMSDDSDGDNDHDHDRDMDMDVDQNLNKQSWPHPPAFLSLGPFGASAETGAGDGADLSPVYACKSGFRSVSGSHSRSRSRSRSRSPRAGSHSPPIVCFSLVKTCLMAAIMVCVCLLIVITWRSIVWLQQQQQQQQQQQHQQSLFPGLSTISGLRFAQTPRPLPHYLYADPHARTNRAAGWSQQVQPQPHEQPQLPASNRIKPWNQAHTIIQTPGNAYTQTQVQPAVLPSLPPHSTKYRRTVTYPMLQTAWNTMSEDAGTPEVIARDMNGPAIDVVYTWVNGSDPTWQAEQAKFGDKSDIANKYREWDELRYSMRSVAMYAPWVRNIIIVTANQIPSWLNTSDPRVRVMFHSQLFPNPDKELPTFNSNAIESVLHRIPNLSDDFIYMNNDLYLARPMARDQLGNATHYYKYVDYGVMLSSWCKNAIYRDSKQENTLRNSIDTCQYDTVFFWQSMLSQHYFRNGPTHWFAHIPHKWNRHVLKYVESRMQRFYDVARQNRFRDYTSDIITHVMYESALTRIAYERSPYSMEPMILPKHLMPQLQVTQDVVVADLSDYDHHHLYQYFVFMNHDTHEYYYSKLYNKMDQYQPLFICIDDDLKDPSEAVLAFHADHFQRFLQRYWPIKASWEL